MGVEQDVARLHVAVDVALRVNEIECGRDPRQPVPERGEAHGGRRRDAIFPLVILQAAAGKILHDGERGPIMLSDVRHLDDVGMSELDQRANLSGESAGELRVLHHRSTRHLDHDVGVEIVVEGAIDVPHPALAELGPDDVAALRNAEPGPVAGWSGHRRVQEGRQRGGRSLLGDSRMVQ